MKKVFSIIFLSLILTACSNTSQKFKGSDFSFSYPENYELKKAATMFVIQNPEGKTVLTMHRYQAEQPEEVIEQMNSVGQDCTFKNGGVRYGGYKSYKILVAEEGKKCNLTGSLVTNKEGIMVLFLVNDEVDKTAQKNLKSSFEFNRI